MAAGFALGAADGYMPVSLVPFYDLVGRIFINALRMVVVPLIAASMITAISSLDSRVSLGRMGLRTVIYYAMTTLAAIVTGIVLVNLLRPGEGAALAVSGDVKVAVTGGLSQVWKLFERMIPPNIVEAAARGHMLGVITFSMLFGIMVRRLEASRLRVMQDFWHGVQDVMMHITELVMYAAPVGVAALVASVASKTGLAAIRPLLTFVAVVILGLAIHFFVTLPLILLLFGRVSPIKHYRAMIPALVTAFSTSSSMATLSVSMKCVRGEGVPSGVAGLVLPLGATVNMDGTALYESVAALFIAQVYGLHLSVPTQVMVVVLALLTSVGVAGVPAASLVAIVIILEAVGLPAEALGLILAVDRPLDMMRTAVNVFSDSCGAVVVASMSGGLEDDTVSD